MKFRTNIVMGAIKKKIPKLRLWLNWIERTIKYVIILYKILYERKPLTAWRPLSLLLVRRRVP